MSDIRIDVKDPPTVGLRPLTSSILGSSRTYSSVASDEVELSSNHERSAHQSSHPSVSRWARTPNEILSESNWTQRYFWRDTWNDVKKFPWAWLGRRFLSHALPLALILCLITLLILMSVKPGIFTNANGEVCDPDGTFSLTTEGYTPWKRDAIFAINLNFGRFSFGVAKLVDVCWDVGIGRGGQAFLAVFSYVVFTKALSRTMEVSSVSHDTFKAITLQNDTITALVTLMRDFFKMGGRRAKSAMAWTILAAAFVLIVPTWLSAMTGYTADIQAYVSDKNGNLVPVDDFQQVVYTIHDGERLGGGRQNDSKFILPWDYTQDYAMIYSYSCNDPYEFNTTGNGNIDWYTSESLDCKWAWAISRYVSDYGFLGKSTITNTTFQLPDGNTTTPKSFDPALNVTANFLDADVGGEYGRLEWNSTFYGRAWRDPETGQYPFNVSDPIFYDNSSDTLYNLKEFNSAGSCLQQGQVRYKWGFSFLLLYAFVVTFLIWTIGMWTLYLDAWLHSRLDLLHRRIGVERAVLDISRSMEPKLDLDQIEMHENSQLQALVKGNMLTYSDHPLQLPAVTRWAQYRWWRRDFWFKRWMKEEKWWLCALFLFTLFFMLSWTTHLRYGWMPYIGMLPGFGVCLVLVVGRQVRSRWVIFAFWFLAFWIPNCWWIDMWRKDRYGYYY